MTPHQYPSSNDASARSVFDALNEGETVLTAIEQLPLAERAAGYVQAHDELLAELEGGDHDR